METPIHEVHRYLLRREEELSRAESLPPGLLPLVVFGRFCSTVLVEFLDDHCMQMAAALSYTSLLALVPVVTLFFSIFTAFAAFDELRRDIELFITEHLFANATLGKQILEHVDRFSENAQRLGLFAVLALIVTVIFLLITVENSLNSIWRVQPSRSFLSRFTTYSALVFLGPILLALSFSLTNQTIRALMTDAQLSPNLWKFFSGVTVSCLMFCLMYMVMPEAKVNFRPALAGGMVAAALFEWAKWGFDQYLQQSRFYFDVYQTLAIVPIFLVWLYLVWLVALLGMEITYVAQNSEHLRAYARSVTGDDDLTSASVVATMVAIARNHFEGNNQGSTELQLSAELQIPLFRLTPIVEHLEVKGFVHRVANASDTYVPNQPLDQVTVQDLLDSLHSDEVILRLSEHDPRFRRLRDAFLRSNVYRDEIFQGMTLQDVVRTRREDNP